MMMTLHAVWCMMTVYVDPVQCSMQLLHAILRPAAAVWMLMQVAVNWFSLKLYKHTS